MSKNTSIKILDCTLRDGGHVNDFAFGRSQIVTIAKCLSLAKIDIIELGFLKDTNYDQDKTLFTKVSQAENLLEGIPLGSEYALMIRPDWYDINQLQPRTGRISKIRWAFHSRDLSLTIQQAERARYLGYEIYFNPVNVFSYSKDSLRDVLLAANQLNPSTVAIVDTHGSMMERDLLYYFELFDGLLNPGIGLSLHLHENLSLSFSLAQKFISIAKGKRNIGIDSSILGMGRIPGNLCTELISKYLNIHQGGQYAITPIYEAIQDPISIIKCKLPWGYAPLYAETAVRKMHRSYAEYLIEDTDMTMQEAIGILEKIVEPDEREHFNQPLVKKLVEQSRSVNHLQRAKKDQGWLD